MKKVVDADNEKFLEYFDEKDTDKMLKTKVMHFVEEFQTKASK